MDAYHWSQNPWHPRYQGTAHIEFAMYLPHIYIRGKGEMTMSLFLSESYNLPNSLPTTLTPG
jgi:hypothetical protein